MGIYMDIVQRKFLLVNFQILTSYQYNKLANAKMIGTYETISFDTNQYVIVKKPVIKKTTKLVYSKKFSSYKSYKKLMINYILENIMVVSLENTSSKLKKLENIE